MRPVRLVIGVVVVLLCHEACVSALDHAALKNEYVYMRERNALREAQHKQSFESNVRLSAPENAVSHYLQALKEEHVRKFTKNFPPAHHFLGPHGYKTVEKTKVYEMMKRLPKGANLHLHDSAWGDLEDLVDHYHRDPRLHMCTAAFCADMKRPRGSLQFFVAGRPPSASWVPAGRFDVSLIKRFVTFRNVSDYPIQLPVDSPSTWDFFQACFTRFAGLVRFRESYERFIRGALAIAHEENVVYVEYRANPGRTYYLDASQAGNGKGGQVPYERSGVGVADTLFARAIVQNFSAEHPDFYGARTIFATKRDDSNRGLLGNLERSLAVQKAVPGYVVGYDLVGEEDAGKPLLHFLDAFNEAYHTLCDYQNDECELYLHAAESNWPHDEIPVASDLAAPVDNLYDSVLLNSRRVGHATALFKRPSLLHHFGRDSPRAIEVAPLSNQLLGYTSDLRIHPAVGYLRAGAQVVLSSDDPGLFLYKYVSFDYYIAFAAWGLDLRGLKQLSYNGLTYSSLPGQEAAEAARLLDAKFDRFTRQALPEACTYAHNFAGEPSFARILPSIGPYDEAHRFQIRGSHFQSQICAEIVTLVDGDRSPIEAAYTREQPGVSASREEGGGTGNWKQPSYGSRMEPLRFGCALLEPSTSPLWTKATYVSHSQIDCHMEATAALRSVDEDRVFNVTITWLAPSGKFHFVNTGLTFTLTKLEKVESREGLERRREAQRFRLSEGVISALTSVGLLLLGALVGCLCHRRRAAAAAKREGARKPLESQLLQESESEASSDARRAFRAV